MSQPIPPVTRAEGCCIGLLVIAGVLLRIDCLESVHVEHFDEGVYASKIWFGSEVDGRYPFQHLYAPPLFPWLTEWSISIFGPTSLGCMFWSLVFGSATIPVIWWLGRRWFGPFAGLVAAALAAGSEFHIVFSRAALTDATLTFWLVVATWLCWEAVERISWPWSMVAGIATGIAWSTKYSGWLPLAIGLAAILGQLVVQPRIARPLTLRRLGIWCVTAIVAAAVWSPVWWELQDKGGYAAVAENHRGYLVGLAGWWESFSRHVSMHQEFETLEFINRAFFVTLGYWIVVRFTWNAADNSALPGADRLKEIWLLVIGFGFLYSLAPGFPVVACGCLAVGFGIFNRWRSSGDSIADRATSPVTTPESDLAFWFAAAWFCGLLLTTPLYRPYPRLALPGLACAWLLTGSYCRQLIEHARFREFSTTHYADMIRRIAAWMFFVFAFFVTTIPGARYDERLAASKVADKINSVCGEGSVLLVHGQPATFFHLRADGAVAVPIGSLDQASQADGHPTYVITTADSFANAANPQRFTVVKKLDLQQSMLVQSNSSSTNLRRPQPVSIVVLRVNG
ncbi:MAG: glycosyltransferase family 39 protein [Planctomycetota bacterium]|nr:glycosyltransferase family 39 protein [Planctomycetota bacterium]